MTLSGSSYLHDRELHRLSMNGSAALRIARGLEIRADGRIAWVQDQIYLSAKGLTEAEALLNIKERAQSFNYSLGITLTVNFGSIYNNVVNNRLRLGPLSFNRALPLATPASRRHRVEAEVEKDHSVVQAITQHISGFRLHDIEDAADCHSFVVFGQAGDQAAYGVGGVAQRKPGGLLVGRV